MSNGFRHTTIQYSLNASALNEDIKTFPQVHAITSDMKLTHKGVSRLVMIDRYSFKDTEKKTLKAGDFVVLTVKRSEIPSSWARLHRFDR
ncbi:hypothetical protein BB777_15670 [Planococcus faecalis]|nr:hypothetical protein BB777_15670 [Planococcus faecalis]